MPITKQHVNDAIDAVSEMHDLMFKRLDNTKLSREILEAYWMYHQKIHDTLVFILREKFNEEETVKENDPKTSGNDPESSGSITEIRD
jgi:hypothetical protein